VATAASKHPWYRLPAKLGRSEVVDLGDSAQFIVGCVSEAGGALDPRVVDQDIDRTGFVFNPLNKNRDLCGVREISGMNGAVEFGGKRF
jgi:hypothetical protein